MLSHGESNQNYQEIYYEDHLSPAELFIVDHLAESLKDNPEALISLEALTRLTAQAKKDNERLHYQATHDMLTGLLNIDGLNEVLAGQAEAVPMLYIDGTNQKGVNDKLGHDRGDEAIIGTAEVITNAIRPGDIAARIGGDEFLVILDPKSRSDSPESYRSTEDVLKPVIERFTEETEAFLQQNPDLLQVGFNIAVGGASGQTGMSVKDIKTQAEAKMYDAKAAQHITSGQYRPIDT